MRADDPDQPIVMLNLLKFREQALDGFGVDGMTGAQAYRRYGELNAEEDASFGGDPIWMGKALHTVIGGEDWDLVILVTYPSRKHFTDKLADPVYLEAAKVRAAAISDSRLIEMRQLLPKK